MRVARSRGVVTGTLLMILGAWGAIIPFVGPYFDYGFGPDKAWLWQWHRLWLNVLPGAAAFLAGLVLLGFAERISMAAAAWLGAAAGAWFAIGVTISRFWNHGVAATGVPMGGRNRVAFEYLGFYYGLAAVVLFLSALALGRMSVVGVRDLRAAERHGDRRDERRDRREAEAAAVGEHERDRGPAAAPAAAAPVAEGDYRAPRGGDVPPPPAAQPPAGTTQQPAAPPPPAAQQPAAGAPRSGNRSGAMAPRQTTNRATTGRRHRFSDLFRRRSQSPPVR